MALSQYIKKWDWKVEQINFDRFIQNFIDASGSDRCWITTTVITYYLDGVAMEGFFTYEYR
jgi:hypothetical protein